MHLLKYFVLQDDEMLMECRKRLSQQFQHPPECQEYQERHIKIPFYFEKNTSPPHRRFKGSTEAVDEEEAPWEESSADGREDIDDKLEWSDDDEEVKDVLQEDGNNLVFSNPKQLTPTGNLLWY